MLAETLEIFQILVLYLKDKFINYYFTFRIIINYICLALLLISKAKILLKPIDIFLTI